MRIGIRAKLVMFLTAMALLPLLGALLAVVSGQRNLRLENVQETFLAVAMAEARGLKNLLIRDLEEVYALVQERTIVEYLSAFDERYSDEELARRDLVWEQSRNLPPGSREMPREVAKVLQGPGIRAVTLLKAANPHFAEVFFTDRHGQLVTASNVTTDYNQRDETWWQKALNAGKGGIAVMPVEPDRSSRTLSIDLCLPVFDAAGVVVGVGKVVVDIEQWLGALKRTVGSVEASVLLVNHDGEITFGGLSGTSSEVLSEWDDKLREVDPSGRPRQSSFRVTEGGQIQAFGPMVIAASELPENLSGFDIHMPWRAIVLYMDASKAYADVYSVTVIALVVGLLGILLLFFLGLYLIDRYVLRRLLRIATVTRQVGSGDLSSRVRPNTPPEGIQPLDEIDELGCGFDRMVEQVERSYEQLSAADALKRDFIRVAGHELRTPISYLTGMARLLRDNRDPERLSDAIRSMGAKAERLSKIIQSMFKLMPEGTLPSTVNYCEIELPGFLERLREDMRPFLEQRALTLVLDIQEGLPPIQADQEKLYDIVENLITNAIKFTPDGGQITVGARLEPVEDLLVLTVSDQGEGIPGEELPHIFEPFFSGRDVLKHSTGQAGFRKRGMGLGLAVVNYFARLHGGSVEVASGPGGSTFSLTLPVRALRPTP